MTPQEEAYYFKNYEVISVINHYIKVITNKKEALPVKVLSTPISIKKNDSELKIYKVFLESEKEFPLEYRLKKLESTLGIIEDELKNSTSKYIEDHNVVHTILLAPEYFLSRKKNTKIIEKNEKYQIEVTLKKLSERFKGILLLPGTLSWKKPGKLDSSKVKSPQFYKNYEEYKNEKIKRGIYNYKTPAEFYNSRIHQSRAKELEKYLINLNYNNYQINHVSSDGNSFNYRVKKFDEDKIKRSFIIVNTAEGYLNGKRIFKQNKFANFKEEENLSNEIFMPGKGKTNINTNGLELLSLKLKNGNKIDIGLEICLDHACGIGKKFWKKAPDIQIIMSDYTDNKVTNFLTKDKGFVIHVSTNKGVDRIYQKSSTNYFSINEKDQTYSNSYNKINIKSGAIKVCSNDFISTYV